ncbi:hypothetical protein [Vibrio crassostreae]|uniref:hypothetical protein n=1 Tax=Vibrio crassostreae TaxID=246167 RepID=UPI001B318827|nr:hypothetical protein [Vibrio crassostreae]
MELRLHFLDEDSVYPHFSNPELEKVFDTLSTVEIDWILAVGSFIELIDLERDDPVLFSIQIEQRCRSLINAPNVVDEILVNLLSTSNASEELRQHFKNLRIFPIYQEIADLIANLKIDLLSIAKFAPFDIARSNFQKTKLSQKAVTLYDVVDCSITAKTKVTFSNKNFRAGWNKFVESALNTELLKGHDNQSSIQDLLLKIASTQSFRFKDSYLAPKPVQPSLFERIKRIEQIISTGNHELLSLRDLQILKCSVCDKEWDTNLFLDMTTSILTMYIENHAVHESLSICKVLLEYANRHSVRLSQYQRTVLITAYQKTVEVDELELPNYLFFLLKLGLSKSVFNVVTELGSFDSGVPFYLVEAIACAHIQEGRIQEGSELFKKAFSSNKQFIEVFENRLRALNCILDKSQIMKLRSVLSTKKLPERCFPEKKSHSMATLVPSKNEGQTPISKRNEQSYSPSFVDTKRSFEEILGVNQSKKNIESSKEPMLVKTISENSEVTNDNGHSSKKTRSRKKRLATSDTSKFRKNSIKI